MKTRLFSIAAENSLHSEGLGEVEVTYDERRGVIRILQDDESGSTERIQLSRGQAAALARVLHETGVAGHLATAWREE